MLRKVPFLLIFKVRHLIGCMPHMSDVTFRIRKYASLSEVNHNNYCFIACRDQSRCHNRHRGEKYRKKQKASAKAIHK